MRDRVRWSQVLSPADLEERTGAIGGAIYGTSSNGASAAFLRPANRSPVPGLGGAVVRVVPTVEYAGPGGSASLNGVAYAENNQHFESRLFVELNASEDAQVRNASARSAGIARAPED